MKLPKYVIYYYLVFCFRHKNYSFLYIFDFS